MDYNVLEILRVVFYDLVHVYEVITPSPREDSDARIPLF